MHRRHEHQHLHVLGDERADFGLRLARLLEEGHVRDHHLRLSEQAQLEDERHPPPDRRKQRPLGKELRDHDGDEVPFFPGDRPDVLQHGGHGLTLAGQHLELDVGPTKRLPPVGDVRRTAIGGDVDGAEIAAGERPNVAHSPGGGRVQILDVQHHGVLGGLGQSGSAPPELSLDPLVVPVDTVEARHDDRHRRDHDPGPGHELRSDHHQ